MIGLDASTRSRVTGLSVLLLVMGVHAADGQQAADVPFLRGLCSPADSTQLAAMTDVVDSPTQPARMIPGGGVPAPKETRYAGYSGKVVLSLVVDTLGQPRPASFMVLESTDPALSRWACAMGLTMRFVPARQDGRPVAVEVMQPYEFSFHTVKLVVPPR